MRLRLFTTLRQRVALLLVSVLVPATVLIIVTALLTRSRDRSDVQQEAYRLARLTSATQERLAGTTAQLFSAPEAVPAVRDGDGDACRLALATVIGSGKWFRNIGVIDDAGSVACSAVPTPSLRVADRPWLTTARHDSALVL